MNKKPIRNTAVRRMADALPLTGLAVAVTRPMRQNDKLMRELRAHGASVTAIPLLAIEPLEEPAQQQKIDHCLYQLADYRIAIFISQNAAEQTLLALASRKLVWPAHIQAFAIGGSTSAFLAEQKIAAVSPTQMDSEGLLALPELQKVAGQRCLIFRGVGGREKLADELRKRGASVDYCEMYYRELPADAARLWAQWLDRLKQQPGLVCINSTETLNHLLTVDHCAATRDNLTLLVPGERVALRARTAGFTNICVATDATDNTILQTAIYWYRS